MPNTLANIYPLSLGGLAYKLALPQISGLLHNPSQDLVSEDIAVNKMLGGGNETISARIGRNKNTNAFASLLASGLDSLDPGHTDRALQQAQTQQPEQQSQPISGDWQQNFYKLVGSTPQSLGITDPNHAQQVAMQIQQMRNVQAPQPTQNNDWGDVGTRNEAIYPTR